MLEDKQGVVIENKVTFPSEGKEASPGKGYEEPIPAEGKFRGRTGGKRELWCV